MPKTVNRFPGTINLAFLRKVYSIVGKGSVLSTQGLLAAFNQSFSPNDLAQFQQSLDGTIQPVSKVIGGHSNNAFCEESISGCR